ncbi:MAG: FxLYD domain-containing protein [Nitrososphaeraceae archaeon]
MKNILIRSALIMAIALTLLASSTLTPVTYSLAPDQSLTNRTSEGLIDLIILDVNASVPEDRNIYTVIGKVLNNDTVPFNGVRVSATLYDDEGQSLVERSAYTSPSGIQPGTNASFNITYLVPL